MKMMIDGDEAMRTFGERIGRALMGTECIELVGDVGAGKTTLAKGIATGLGITDTVQSPTFTINRTYDSPRGLVLSHYDFYRLSDPGIMSAELEETLQDPKSVIVIEWGDIVADVLPRDHMRITFASPTETSRILDIQAYGPVSERLLGELA